MIYITGDCHGEFNRFTTANFPEQKEMTREDCVIVCGDFGYWDRTKETAYWMDWLNDKPFTTLWVDGNHENYDMIAELPADSWKGGRVQRVRESVIHLMRGQVYEIGGAKFFTFGGAASHDIEAGILDPHEPGFKLKKKRLDRERQNYRVNRISWWEEEMPDEEDFAEGIRNLEAADFSVDFIITHCCATSTQALLSGGAYQRDRLTDYFDEIKDRTKFRKWFFGHYHVDRNITPEEIALHRQIIRIL